MEKTVGETLKKKIKKRQNVIRVMLQDNSFIESAVTLSSKIIECFENGNKLFFCGNGGSAADCQHIVAEFVVKLTKFRRSLPAIALTSNNSIITATSNDMDYKYIFVRQVESLVNPCDILIGISTSGNSQNIIDAFKYANEHNIFTVSITGSSLNKLREIAKKEIIIPIEDTQIIQEMYMMFFHIVCEIIDDFYLDQKSIN